MDFGALFNTAIGSLDMLKPETLEKLGPFGTGVQRTGQAVAAASALLWILFGKSRWAPPTSAMPTLPVIGLAIAVAAGLIVIFSVSGTSTSQVNLWRWSFILLGAGGFLVLIYFIIKSRLLFSCSLAPDVMYVAGLWLKQQARFVLQGKVEKLTSPYILHRLPNGSLDIPTGPKDFFCRTEKGSDFVWSERSVIASHVLLIFMFWLAPAPLSLALYAASAALTQPDLKVEEKSITLPADVLFAFDSDTIRTTAAASLAGPAETIRKKRVSQA